MALVGKTIRLQEEVWSQVKSYADARGCSLSEAIGQMIRGCRDSSGTAADALAPTLDSPQAGEVAQSDLVDLLQSTVDDLRRRLDANAQTERELRVIIASQSSTINAFAAVLQEGLPQPSQDTACLPTGKKKKKGKGGKKGKKNRAGRYDDQL